MSELIDRYNTLQEKLQAYQQEHVFSFWNELDEAQKEQLLAQVESVDLEQLTTLTKGEDTKQDFEALARNATPPPSVSADGQGASWSRSDARERGEDALRAGQIGAVIVAGGQGTRLGFDQPKGMFPIGPISNRTLFQFFADKVIATQALYGVKIPLFIMTSEATDADTRDYFESNDFLGLSSDDVVIFRQGTMPAVDVSSGRLLLATKDSLALSPDGHGGTVAALDKNGCFQMAKERGIKHLSYIQVDNPLAHLCEPTLLGHHLLSESEMTTQVIRKRYANERVGNVVSIDGNVQIIEYSDLPDTAAEATDSDGNLRLWAGNIAVHVLDVEFLSRSVQSAEALPFHRALKKVPYLDPSGAMIQPEQPNATKFERFIFDLLPQARNAFVAEVLACEGFAPVKNAEGAATDTASLARRAISDLHRGWIESAGAVVAPGVQVEINPKIASSPEALGQAIPDNLSIDKDLYFDTRLR
ncbi:MAG: UDPGP type 1 family protein [Planctomycetota bacterium]